MKVTKDFAIKLALSTDCYLLTLPFLRYKVAIESEALSPESERFGRLLRTKTITPQSALRRCRKG
jgi:hypothetical protein